MLTVKIRRLFIDRKDSISHSEAISLNKLSVIKHRHCIALMELTTIRK